MFGAYGDASTRERQRFELFFQRGIDEALQLALLELLARFDPVVPTICTAMALATPDVVVRLAKFESRNDGDHYEHIGRAFGDNEWDCMASIADPGVRRAALGATKKYANDREREDAIDQELARLELGAGDIETLAAMVIPEDIECRGDWTDERVNKIAGYLGKPKC